MASPCTNDPNEVISAVVGIQTAEENFEQELDDAVDTVTENADKFNSFVNGTDTQTVQLGEGAATPTIRNTVRQMLSAASELPSADASGKSATANNGGSALRTLAERFADIVNVKDFGAKGDGTTDDTAAITAAMSAAEGKTLYFPEGTYLTTAGIRIPSNTTVCGAGMFQSTIKIADGTHKSVDAVTNEQNTWTKDPSVKWTDNLGNKNIILRDICVDGNAWNRSGTGYSACAVQFCYVENLLIENVYAKRGPLHCIDISSASYGGDWDFEDGDEGYYYGSSKNVVISNCLCEDSGGDDAITTHFSHNINIYNPICIRTRALESTTQVGIEIDDGSYDVRIYGGYCSGWLMGFQVKSHDYIPTPPHSVYVNGLVCEGNVINFEATHKKLVTTINENWYLKNISFVNCTAIKATQNVSATYEVTTIPQEFILADVDGAVIDNCHIEGDKDYETDHGKIALRTCKNIHISNTTFVNCSDTLGLVYFDAYCGGGNTAKNIKAYECVDNPVFFFSTKGGSEVGIKIDGVEAVRTVGAGDTQNSPVINSYRTQFDFQRYAGSLDIKNVIYSGYKCIIGEIGDNNTTTSLKIENGEFITQEKKIYRKALQTVSAGVPMPLSVGYAAYDSATLYGEGVGYGFKYKSPGGTEYQVGSVFVTKESATGSDTSHSLCFAVRNNDDSGTKDAVRWRIRLNGMLQPFTDNTYSLGNAAYRPSVLWAASGTISTSDARMKHNIQNVDESVLRAWGKVRFAVFQMADAVEEKGEENARIHVGVIAQEVRDAFASEGLDAGRYGLFCYDEWEDEYQNETVVDKESVFSEDGKVVEPEVTHVERRLVRKGSNRFSIRYDEALALECAYQRWLGEQRDARIAALEARLNEISGNSPAPSGASPDNL